MKLADIKPNPGNPRTISEEKLEKLANSIKDFPKMMVQRPIVVKDGIIIGGNMRYRAIEKLGMTEIPDNWVSNADDYTEAERRRFIMQDNTAGGENDWDMVANEYEVEELDAWGVDLPKNMQVEDEVEEDEAPEVSKDPPQSVLGAVYQLGRHRVMCGDSTDFGSLTDLLDGKVIDLVFTDPPYQLETNGGKKGSIGKSLSSQGQNIEFISDFAPHDMLSLLPDVFQMNKLNAYIFTNKELLPDYLVWAKDNKYAFNVLVWKKPNAIPIGSDYKPDTEYILFFRKNATWNTSVQGVNYSRVIESDRETGLHPTMKPQFIIINCLKASSNLNDTVLDLFLGSGSTLIACEQTDRTCYGMELDPKYVDVIRKRYAKFISPDDWETEWQALTPQMV